VPAVDASAFRAELVSSGLLVLTGVDGVYGRSGTYEDVAAAVDGLVLAAGVDEGADTVRFPPVMARDIFERSGYLESFPDLMGSVHTFAGGEAEHAELLGAVERGEPWAHLVDPAEVVLCPAVCHPLYPTCRGTLPEGGRRVVVYGYCFRHQPSPDPFRMQAFRQHDYVRIGTDADAVAHRDRWLQRGLDLLAGLGLPVEAVVANDPFFGRAGRLLKASQREQTLKYEIVTPCYDEARPTAVSSANCHLDHFGAPFGIVLPDGTVAHSACFGFGVDRITLALFLRFGTDPGAWPSATRAQLWP
jgi:seryl-tRNA synthetase